MGEEHDSWLEELGVNFDPPDPGALASGLREAVQSGQNAVQDLDHAKTDMENAARTEVVAKTQYIEAGVLDGIGAHDTAQDLRTRAGANEADASDQFEDGMSDFGKVADFVSGDDDGAPRVSAEPKHEDTKNDFISGDDNGDRRVLAQPKDDNSKKAKSARDRKLPMGVLPMQPDCKIVRGKVPGPANHVLCFTHNHVVDLATKTIISLSLEDYKKRYGGGGA